MCWRVQQGSRRPRAPKASASTATPTPPRAGAGVPAHLLDRWSGSRISSASTRRGGSTPPWCAPPCTRPAGAHPAHSALGGCQHAQVPLLNSCKKRTSSVRNSARFIAERAIRQDHWALQAVDSATVRACWLVEVRLLRTRTPRPVRFSACASDTGECANVFCSFSGGPQRQEGDAARGAARAAARGAGAPGEPGQAGQVGAGSGLHLPRGSFLGGARDPLPHLALPHSRGGGEGGRGGVGGDSQG